ncbi:MAG: type III pantothenate kinase [Porticoccaceae bacterium]|nr:type III pantothenate kinase [Porticoccaceae bacterium]
MILDIDIGNSRIKWRLVDNGKPVATGSQATSAVAAGEPFELLGVTAVDEARAASVADSAVTAALQCQLADRFSVVLKMALVTRSAGGVTCAYEDTQKLGVDRWLAVVAAYGQFKEALLVVDVGSAITMDLLGPQGGHLGGYIIPGLRLMRDALWRDTSEVKVAGSDCQDLLLPGKDSQQAVNRGCLLAAAAAVEKLASQYPVRIVVTGGDAQPLIEALSLRVLHCPDLVLDGLSVDTISFIDTGS